VFKERESMGGRRKEKRKGRTRALPQVLEGKVPTRLGKKVDRRKLAVQNGEKKVVEPGAFRKIANGRPAQPGGSGPDGAPNVLAREERAKKAVSEPLLEAFSKKRMRMDSIRGSNRALGGAKKTEERDRRKTLRDKKKPT